MIRYAEKLELAIIILAAALMLTLVCAMPDGLFFDCLRMLMFFAYGFLIGKFTG